jgi:hypothetical protein
MVSVTHAAGDLVQAVRLFSISATLMYYFRVNSGSGQYHRTELFRVPIEEIHYIATILWTANLRKRG